MPSGRFPAPEHRAPFCSRVSRPCRAVLPRQLPAEDQSATKEQTELVFLALQQQSAPSISLPLGAAVSLRPLASTPAGGAGAVTLVTFPQ